MKMVWTENNWDLQQGFGSHCAFLGGNNMVKHTKEVKFLIADYFSWHSSQQRNKLNFKNMIETFVLNQLSFS